MKDNTKIVTRLQWNGKATKICTLDSRNVCLTLSMLGKIFSGRHSEIFSYLLSENRI